MKNILVIDAQGGGVGKALIERIRALRPDADITAAGTNTAATAAMLKAGADRAATGENAIVVCARRADVIAGPIGIVLKDAMLGEITEKMAAAVGESEAERVLVPVKKCRTHIAGTENLSLQKLQDEAAQAVAERI